MEEKFQAQQQTIIYSALSQLKQHRYDTVAKLTDTYGITGSLFNSHHYRVAWEAMQELYTKQASSGGGFSVQDVLGSIEQNYRRNGKAAEADKLMGWWGIRIAGLSGEYGNPIEAARQIKEERLYEKFTCNSETWNERIRTAQDRSQAIADISYELQGLARTGGERGMSIRDAIKIAAKARPISCGNKWMDERLFWNTFANCGGFAPTMLYVISAPSKHGKTASAATFATNWVGQGNPCVVISGEESVATFSVRAAKALARELPHLIVDGVVTDSLNDNMRTAVDLLDKNLFTYRLKGGVSEIANIIMRHRTQFGNGEPLLVMIDHINALAFDRQDIDVVAERIKTLADDFSVPIILYGQPSPAMEMQLKERNFTKDFGVRGSGGVFQWADYFVAMCRHTGMPHATVVMSGKNRFDDEGRIDIATDRYISRWGVFQFQPTYGIITNNLIMDDLDAEADAYAIGRTN